MPIVSAEHTYRAFISYSHLDGHAYAVVSETLRRVGLEAWSDKDLAAGKGFTEGIQTDITHSHVFVPILTPRSHERGWVHQEIGYAEAMKVPCVPVCIGKVPEGMIAMRHAVKVDEELNDLERILQRVNFQQLVREAGREWVPRIGCANEPEKRAEMIERFSDEAISRFKPFCVRIQGSLNSFSLPDEPPDHPAWKARYGDKPRTPHAYEWYRRERQALERHAVKGGLKMIVNYGLDIDGAYGQGAKRSRLSILVKFLESSNLPNENASIALIDRHPPDMVLAVGNWFVAESLAGRPVRGVIGTVFTAHAPTVSRAVEDFDHKLATLLTAQGTSPVESRQWAIDKLRSVMDTLPRHSDWFGYQ
ncbi:MAG TPA: toll/interleukin-1 receptor domain-containing protein [Pirellulales bacterium]|jgi:hypothetical protein